MRSAQAGDRQALNDLLEALRAYFLRSLRTDLPLDDALDVAQEALVRVYRDLSTLDAERPLIPWANRVLHHALSDCRRKWRRRPPVSLGDGSYREGGSPWDELEDPSPTAPEILNSRIRRELLLSLARRLPAEERYVLNLRCFRDLTFREIAELTGMSVQRAHRVCTRARARLASLLRDHSGGESWLA